MVVVSGHQRVRPVYAKALRVAGLVKTTRDGRGVRYSLTPLGRSLLDGQ
jgi:DNA-binding transcriptional ArsR family regulator